MYIFGYMISTDFFGHIHYDKKYIMSGACDQNIYRIAHIEYVHNPIKRKKK